MKVLLNLSLEERHVEQIQSVAEQVELVRPTASEELLEAVEEAVVLFGEFDGDLFQRARCLRWVQSAAAGVDGLLFPELVDSEVILVSAKGTVGSHLADHAMALLLGLTRGIAWALRKPDWDQRWPIRNASWELAGRKMGIVGLGGTGRDLALRARGFGMQVLAVDPEEVEVPECVESCWSMDRFYDLLAEVDVVAICAPLTRETEGMFDRKAFQRMREHALLINVTRGKIVLEDALIDALEQGMIGGAGLDVTPREPLPQEHSLWHMENVIITPHTAGGSPHRLDRIVEFFAENLGRWLAGDPLLGVIDKHKGY